MKAASAIACCCGGRGLISVNSKGVPAATPVEIGSGRRRTGKARYAPHCIFATSGELLTDLLKASS